MLNATLEWRIGLPIFGLRHVRSEHCSHLGLKTCHKKSPQNWRMSAERHIPWDNARELHVRHMRVRKRFLSPGVSHLGCTNINAGCCLLVFSSQKGQWYLHQPPSNIFGINNKETTQTSWARWHLQTLPTTTRVVYRLDSPGTRRPLRPHLADVYPWLTSIFFPAICMYVCLYVCVCLVCVFLMFTTF